MQYDLFDGPMYNNTGVNLGLFVLTHKWHDFVDSIYNEGIKSQEDIFYDCIKYALYYPKFSFESSKIW